MVNPTSSRSGARSGAGIAAIAKKRMTSEDLKREEDDLFEDWKRALCRGNARNILVRDGAMSGYAETKRKILFILKEVSSDFSHESDDGIADLRRAPSWSKVEGRWRRTWYPIIAWTAALNPDPRFDGDVTSDEIWERVIPTIAIVNLKKTPGGTTADRGEIERFVREHADWLKKQLSLYRPHLTICGGAGVADCLISLYGEKWARERWRERKRGDCDDDIQELDSDELGHVIDFWHPAQIGRQWPELVTMLKEIEADWSSTSEQRSVRLGVGR